MLQLVRDLAGRWHERLGMAGVQALVMAALALTVWWLGAYIQFRFADEGFLWYGAQRVLAGEVPLGDFFSYDPARYYWIAAVMALSHSYGMVAVNVASALWGAFGIWLALRLISRGRSAGWPAMALSAMVFFIWAVPRAHLMDVAASVVLVASLTWMLESPRRLRCFLTGVCLGVIAIVRRDHGLYGGLAEFTGLALVAGFGRKGPFLPSFRDWAAGVVLGYSPMLLAVVWVPDFWQGLWESIDMYIVAGATNTTLPIPWPWATVFGGVHSLAAVRSLLLGLLLLALPLFGLGLVLDSVRRMHRDRAVNPLLFAAGLLAIPYAHHGFARAGIDHLGSSGAPALIGLLTLLVGLPRSWAVATGAMLCVLSALVLAPMHPFYQEWSEGDWVNAQVGPDVLKVPPIVAAKTSAAMQLVATYAPAPGQELAAMPVLSGVYAVTGRRAAVWDTYVDFPMDTAMQEAEIARLQAEHPGLVILGSSAPYRRTHALIYDFLMSHYREVQPDFLPPELGWQVYLPAGAMAPAGTPK